MQTEILIPISAAFSSLVTFLIGWYLSKGSRKRKAESETVHNLSDTYNLMEKIIQDLTLRITLLDQQMKTVKAQNHQLTSDNILLRKDIKELQKTVDGHTKRNKLFQDIKKVK